MYPVYADFQSFRGGGVYKWNGTSPKVETDGKGLGHAVCVIGFDDSRQAWLIKNSWGTNWGSGGFAYFAYGESGIDAQMWGVNGLSTIYPFLTTAGLPSVCVYQGQTHYCYRDSNNNIQDVVWTGSNWAIQQIAGPGSTSGGPAAASNPAVVGFHDEMHCFYYDSAGEIWDAEWSGSRWYSFQLTGNGGIAGSTPVRPGSNLAAIVYGDQIHCVYRDTQTQSHRCRKRNQLERSTGDNAFHGKTPLQQCGCHLPQRHRLQPVALLLYLRHDRPVERRRCLR